MLIGYARVLPRPESRSESRSACQSRLQEDLRRQDQRKSRIDARTRQSAGSAREGDTLVVWKLDRRTEAGSILWTSSQNCIIGRALQILTDAIDTGTASGGFLFHVMASLAEMERELTIERTHAGLKVARQLGRTGGRKRQMT